MARLSQISDFSVFARFKELSETADILQCSDGAQPVKDWSE
jgi:hypothetical protein